MQPAEPLSAGAETITVSLKSGRDEVGADRRRGSAGTWPVPDAKQKIRSHAERVGQERDCFVFR